ncbi:carbamate kinase [Peptostreptococcaceae bacterium AS15]|nr:carbamate kinase [Peptostreptococcaceae bacterium AS15]
MKIVLALGGNALGNTPEEQKEAVKTTAKSIIDLIQSGNKVIIGHGNGPQVGMINNAMDIAAKAETKIPKMPFPECGAMSQGYIGYHLQNAIKNEAVKRGRADLPVVTIVTQTLVDENDPAFKNPTKPVGSFMTKEEADVLIAKGIAVKEDAGRGYRTVVPSPKPVDIVEKDSLMKVFDNRIVMICGGGGGIPVVKRGDELVGVPAVIDKDFTCEKIAEILDADVFLVLTAVDKVAIRFGQPDVKWLDTITLDEVQKYIDDKEFAEGSMLPKVLAAVEFAKSKKGRKAIITSLEKADEAIAGKTGTVIVNE